MCVACVLLLSLGVFFLQSGEQSLSVLIVGSVGLGCILISCAVVCLPYKTCPLPPLLKEWRAFKLCGSGDVLLVEFVLVFCGRGQ